MWCQSSNLPLSIYVYAFIILRMGQALPITLISALLTIFVVIFVCYHPSAILATAFTREYAFGLQVCNIFFYRSLCYRFFFRNFLGNLLGSKVQSLCTNDSIIRCLSVISSIDSFGKSFRKSLSFFPSFLPPSSSSLPIETR